LLLGALGSYAASKSSAASKRAQATTTEDTRLADEELIASNIERPVQLLLELSTKNGTIAAVHTMDQEHILETQKLVKGTEGKALEEQNHAVEQAVRKLYTHPPRSGQLKALQHLLYTRKDLILIAKTSFGKSMLLQTPLLCAKSTALIILRTIAIDPIFYDKVGLIVVDEAHLASE
jgi:hypothetical protein